MRPSRHSIKHKIPTLSAESLPWTWKSVKRRWGHSLHSLCSRTGSFPPALAHYFIQLYSKEKDVVFDPFSGRGTLPLQACVEGRLGIGNDLMPDAYILTAAKVNPLEFTEFQEYAEQLQEEIARYTRRIDLRKTSSDIRVFYHPNTLRQIIALRELFLNSQDNECDFPKALMLGILHGNSKLHLSLPCSHSFSMSPKYVRRYAKEHNLERPKRNVIDSLILRAQRVLRDGIPDFFVRGKAYQVNSRYFNELQSNSVKLIITSPPYFKAQTYAWDNWLRLWFLGYDFKEVRMQLNLTNQVEKYKDFMLDCMHVMFRLLKEDCACFVVVGDVKIGKETVNTAELLVNPASQVGFLVERIIEDRIIKSRKYMSHIAKSNTGVKIDRILELHKGDVTPRDDPILWSKP